MWVLRSERNGCFLDLDNYEGVIFHRNYNLAPQFINLSDAEIVKSVLDPDNRYRLVAEEISDEC